MSGNPIFDTIEDEILRALESGFSFPDEIKIRLGDDQVRALVKAGLLRKSGAGPRGERMPDDMMWCRFSVAGISVEIAADSHQLPPVLH